MALAHHEAIQKHFTDGILWLSLGPTPQLENEQAIWAKALGVDLSPYLELNDKKQALQQKIADRKLLIIIDDVWHSDHAELFHFGAPNCTYFLTTRNQDIARGFASPKHVRSIIELKDDDAYDLLSNLAPEVCSNYPDESRTLSDKLGGLPLAIELIGAYLSDTTVRSFKTAQEKGLTTVSNPRERLELATKRLGDLSNKEQSLSQIIKLSLEALDETSQAAFYALGAFAPKPDSFSLEAAKAVTETDEEPLSQLYNSNLLDKDKNTETLSIHQVLADVARQHTSEAAYQRHADYYLNQVERDRQNWQHIESLYPQLSHAAERLKASEAEGFLDFIWALRIYHDRRGLRQIELDWYELGLKLCRKTGNREGEATTLSNIGAVYDALGDRHQALNYYNQALPIQREVGDREGEAITLNNIGRVYDALGDRHQALNHYNQALPIQREVGDRAREAATLNNMGLVYDALGDRQQALTFFNQVLPIRREVGDRAGEATTLSNIGLVYYNLGDRHQALNYYNQALPIQREVGDRAGEATTLNNMGAVYDALGDRHQALNYYNQALPIRREVGDREGEAGTLNNIGAVYYNLGDRQRALTFFNQVLPIFREVGDRAGEATTRFNIAMIYREQGQREAAIMELEQVVVLEEQVQHPNLESDKATLEELKREFRSRFS